MHVPIQSSSSRVVSMHDNRQRGQPVQASSPPKDTKTAFRESRSASVGRARSPDQARKPVQRTLSKNLSKTIPKQSITQGQVRCSMTLLLLTSRASAENWSHGSKFPHVVEGALLPPKLLCHGLQPAPGPRVRDKFVSLPVEVDEKAVADQQSSAAAEQQPQVAFCALLPANFRMLHLHLTAVLNTVHLRVGAVTGC